jgi:hypothetical protein
MQLARKPRTPSPHVFIQVASPTIPTAWRSYLSMPLLEAETQAA